MSERQGVVKFFIRPRNYGFISRDGLPDLFFHYRDWLGSGEPLQGAPVTFTEIVSPSGKPAAQAVRPIDVARAA